MGSFWGDTNASIYSFITLQLRWFEDFCSSSSCFSNTMTVTGKWILLVTRALEISVIQSVVPTQANPGDLYPWESLTAACAGTFCPSYLPCYIALLVTFLVTGWTGFTSRFHFCQRLCSLLDPLLMHDCPWEVYIRNI